MIISIIIVIVSLNQNLIVRNYYIKSEKLAKNEYLNIVLIADLHSTIHSNNQKSLIDKVKNSNPDLILLAGDIYDDRVPILGTELFLDGVKDIAPVYYVKGNHEYWTNNIDFIHKVFKTYGVNILSDNYVQTTINNINLVIAGIEDPYKNPYQDKNYNQTKAMQEAFKNLQSLDGYKLLLAHRPERINEYLKYPFDLVVSGHAHGGQVRVPFIINGLYSPNQGWFPKYAGGVYKHDSLTHVVSRGLSIHPKLPRIFNPPEVVVIKIQPN